MNNYIVTTKKGILISDVDFDLKRDTSASPISNVPNRAVVISKSITGSARNTMFTLTKAEAATLRNDSRIEFVTKQYTGSEGDGITGSLNDQYDDYRLPYYNAALMSNKDENTTGFPWVSSTGTNAALKYMTTNQDLSVLHTPEIISGSKNTQKVGTVMSGRGVDLIVVDQGIVDRNHQEFLRDPAIGIRGLTQTTTDTTTIPANASRLNYIKWFDYTGLSGTDPSQHNFVNNIGDHGTQCASIAGGNVFGWAPNVEIFTIAASDEISTAIDNRYSFVDVFPLIKKFHENKSVDVATGHKRPTVVSISIALADRFYRGQLDAGDGLSHVNIIAPTGSIMVQGDGGTSNDLTASLAAGFPVPSLAIINDNDGGPPSINWTQTNHSYNRTTSKIHTKWHPGIAADADEASDAGVIIICAAGNQYMPTAGSGSSDPSSPDYDKYFEPNYYSPMWESYYTYDQDNSRYDAGDKVYYHRAGAPGGNSTVQVADIQHELNNNAIVSSSDYVDLFASSDAGVAGNNSIAFGVGRHSQRGPRVDIGALSKVNCATIYHPNSGSNLTGEGDDFLRGPYLGPAVHSRYILSDAIATKLNVGDATQGIPIEYATPPVPSAPHWGNQYDIVPGYDGTPSYGQIGGSAYNSEFNKNFCSTTFNGGTSFAAPQIAGLACRWAQLNPSGNVIDFKKFLKQHANSNSLEEPGFTDPSTENGNYFFRNKLSGIHHDLGGVIGTSNYPDELNTNDVYLKSAQHRPSTNRIKLANWPIMATASIQLTGSYGAVAFDAGERHDADYTSSLSNRDVLISSEGNIDWWQLVNHI